MAHCRYDGLLFSIILKHSVDTAVINEKKNKYEISITQSNKTSHEFIKQLWAWHVYINWIGVCWSIFFILELNPKLAGHTSINPLLDICRVSQSNAHHPPNQHTQHTHNPPKRKCLFYIVNLLASDDDERATDHCSTDHYPIQCHLCITRSHLPARAALLPVPLSTTNAPIGTREGNHE